MIRTVALLVIGAVIGDTAWRLFRRLGRALDQWALAFERSTPAGPEVGAIDDDGSFCTGEPVEVSSLDQRKFLSQPKAVRHSPVAHGVIKTAWDILQLVDHEHVPGCTWDPPELQWADQSQVPASLPGWTSCCDGTGFADYAAVPCPALGCPAVKAALRNAFPEEKS